MNNPNEIFELEYQGKNISVEKVSLSCQVFFRIHFSNGIAPLNILKTMDIKQSVFWTSIPEGRLQVALEIGPLIDQYYQSKEK